MLIKRTIPDIFSHLYTQNGGSNYSAWNFFWFHSFTPQTIKNAIVKHNWDWVTFTLEYSKFMKNFFNSKNSFVGNSQDVDYKDEDVVEKQKSMTVSFLYLTLLLNVERTLFNFDHYNFMEEQIMLFIN